MLFIGVRYNIVDLLGSSAYFLAMQQQRTRFPAHGLRTGPFTSAQGYTYKKIAAYYMQQCSI